MSAFKITANENYLKAVPTDKDSMKLVVTDQGDEVSIHLGVGRNFSAVTMTTYLDPDTAMELAGWLFNWAHPRIDASDHTTTVGEALRRLVKK